MKTKKLKRTEVKRKATKEEINLAIAFYGLCQTTVLVIDRLQGTSLYKTLIKNLCNKLMTEVESQVNRVWKQIENEKTEKQFHQTTEMVEIIVRVMENKNMGEFISLLREYEDGRISIVPEDKHQKFVSQLDKL